MCESEDSQRFMNRETFEKAIDAARKRQSRATNALQEAIKSAEEKIDLANKAFQTAKEAWSGTRSAAGSISPRLVST